MATSIVPSGRSSGKLSPFFGRWSSREANESVRFQIGCIGPLVYSIIHKCTNLSLPPAPAIQALLIFCTISMFAMAFSWQATAVVFGESHAVALIVLMLFVALVNSTSNVLFMPYMITFHPVYLTAYFVGMGLSSLIPSIVSLAQGKKRSPMFSKKRPTIVPTDKGTL